MHVYSWFLQEDLLDYFDYDKFVSYGVNVESDMYKLM